MNEQLQAVVRQINEVGARYKVHDEKGEYVTEDTCDSLVVLHEANGKIFFLHRPLGWVNGPQYEHMVETDTNRLRATLEPLYLRMVRRDGWAITFTPLDEGQKRDWVRWREYKAKQDWYDEADTDTIAKWREVAKRLGGADAVHD